MHWDWNLKPSVISVPSCFTRSPYFYDVCYGNGSDKCKKCKYYMKKKNK